MIRAPPLTLLLTNQPFRSGPRMEYLPTETFSVVFFLHNIEIALSTSTSIPFSHHLPFLTCYIHPFIHTELEKLGTTRTYSKSPIAKDQHVDDTNVY
ncbi:hypothetical protein PAXRUDRAFT_735781 [Paxillus rubicundulus Ve08.2h10]|uniref:Uncharacterized protein n=1 Tax=Paxillus rubicundulus Ve08.2h10 TaxID=930991 RepID=A0A0D0E7X0_9AGAM|nr:hypothetical protein PAXRUDRAFT_735781 [Paxillus rubicundulus Ve08.2h10]